MLGASGCRSSSLGPWCSRLISGLGTTMPSPKNLDDILKLDTLADKSPEEIEAIWMEVLACLQLPAAPFATVLTVRKPQMQSGPGTGMPCYRHSLPDMNALCVCVQFHSNDLRSRAGVVIPGADYDMLQSRASSAPLFVLPLGKGNGHSVSMLLQWQLPHALFTVLEDYRACELHPVSGKIRVAWTLDAVCYVLLSHASHKPFVTHKRCTRNTIYGMRSMKCDLCNAICAMRSSARLQVLR